MKRKTGGDNVLSGFILMILAIILFFSPDIAERKPRRLKKTNCLPLPLVVYAER